MKVKVQCDSCGRKIKIRADSMKEVKEIKKALGCTCMNCLRIPDIDSKIDYGNKVILVW